MDNPNRVIIFISLAVVFVSIAFIELRAYYAVQYEIAVLQNERQFTKDREDIVDNFGQKIERINDKHETELARRQAQFEAEILKNKQALNDFKIEFEKRISMQVVDIEKKLQRQRARNEEEIENREKSIKNVQTLCDVQVAKLVDNHKDELIKQTNDCERNIDNVQQKLHAIIVQLDEVKTDLLDCEQAEDKKTVLDNAIALLKSIACSQMFLPIDMCMKRI